jgi:hypothetical protein
MVAEWSVECSADDPVLVVPWSAAEAGSQTHSELGDFVDLRENPYDLDQIPEADLYPALMQALRALNAPRSAVFTAKCDAWPLDAEEMEALRQHLDLTQDTGRDRESSLAQSKRADASASGSAVEGDDAHDDAAAGFASYIDLIWRDRTIFASFHQSEQILHRLARLAASIDQSDAMLECVLRPAMVDLTGPQEGFALTVYVKAVGPDAFTAKQVWAAALDAVVALIRGRDGPLA